MYTFFYMFINKQWLISPFLYMSIYIYVCVCVCVCVRTLEYTGKYIQAEYKH